MLKEIFSVNFSPVTGWIIKLFRKHLQSQCHMGKNKFPFQLIKYLI